MTSPLCFLSDGMHGAQPASFLGSNNWFAQHLLEACAGGAGGGASVANHGSLFGAAPSTLLASPGDAQASAPSGDIREFIAMTASADPAACPAVPTAPMLQEDEIFLAQLQAMLQDPCGTTGGSTAAATALLSGSTFGCSIHDEPQLAGSAAVAAPVNAPPAQGFHLPSQLRSAENDSRRREHSDGPGLPLPLRAAKSLKTSPQSWPGSPVRTPLTAASRLAPDVSPVRTSTPGRLNFPIENHLTAARALGAARPGAELGEPKLASLGSLGRGNTMSRLSSMDAAAAAASADAVSPKRSASGGAMGSLSDEPQRSSGSGSASASASPPRVSAKNAATPATSHGDGGSPSDFPQPSGTKSGGGGGRFGQQIKPKSMTEKHRRERISEGMNRLRMVVDAHGDVASMLNYAVDYIQNMQAANKGLRLELLRRQLSCTCNASSNIAPGTLIQHLNDLQK